MSKQLYRNPFLFPTLTALALLGDPRASQAQTWQVLSPTSTFAPTRSLRSVLVDPYPADPRTPGVLVVAGGGSLYQMSPDVELGAFVGELVDEGAMSDIRSLGYVENDGTPSGTFYAVGQALVSGRAQNLGVWKVRSSHAGGAVGTWGDEAPWALNSKADALAWGFASDARGNAFVCGWAYANTKGDNNCHWIVRRKPPGGSFATVSDIKTSANVGAAAEAMCALPGDGVGATVVFAVGHIGYRWTVMRSQQSGAAGSWLPAGASTWPTARSLAVATDAACDSYGNVYVVGYYDGGYALGCIVQASSDGGNTWQTLLDESSDRPTGIWRVTTDPLGRVTLAGTIFERDGTNPRWTVVRPSNPQSTASWQAAYANPLAHPFAGTGNRARAISADVLGNVFVAGEVASWNGFNGSGLLRLMP